MSEGGKERCSVLLMPLKDGDYPSTASMETRELSVSVDLNRFESIIHGGGLRRNLTRKISIPLAYYLSLYQTAGHNLFGGHSCFVYYSGCARSRR